MDLVVRKYEFAKNRSVDSDTLPFVSVIVPTLGREWLGQCLTALAGYQYPQYEVIVATDRARKGPGYVRNRALELAKGDLVHFIDDDGIASPDNLLELVKAFLKIQREDRSIGGLSGAIVDYSGNRSVACRVSFSFSGLKVTSEASEGITEYAFTGNALFPKNVLEQVNGFDEQISHQFEDVDLSMRIRERGRRLYAISSAAVYHVARNPRASVLDKQFRSFYSSRNYVILLSKWMSFHYALLVGYCLSLANAVVILPSAFMIARTNGRRSNTLGFDLPHIRFEKALGSLYGLAALSKRIRVQTQKGRQLTRQGIERRVPTGSSPSNKPIHPNRRGFCCA